MLPPFFMVVNNIEQHIVTPNSGSKMLFSIVENYVQFGQPILFSHVFINFEEVINFWWCIWRSSLFFRFSSFA